MRKKLILVTNDDGIQSPGLAAAVNAVRGLGEILVVAPQTQQSSSGRALYWKEERARKVRLRAVGENISAYAVNGSPAVAVRHALDLLAERTPALVVSGINYGENLGSGLTMSGTVGAAIEAAVAGVPALAVALQTEIEFHASHSTAVDFRRATLFTRRFAKYMLKNELPTEMQLLNVNVPSDATRQTPWRATRASTQAYFKPFVQDKRYTGYGVRVDLDTLEPNSDIHAIFVDHVVSVTPLTYDLTARVRLATFAEVFENA